MPSPLPSVTGWVATVTATTATTSQMEQNTVDDYASTVAEYYGVEPNDVTVTTSYEVPGTLSMIIPEMVSEEDVIDTVTASIADSLGVHPQDVEVTVDMSTGEVEFTVVSDNFNDAAGIAFDLENFQYQDMITESIQTSLPVSVDNIDVSDEVTASLQFTVDANDASNDLTQAAWQSEQLLSGFDVTVDNSYVTQAPTFVPSIEPTTSLPTSSPSITGNIQLFNMN